MNFLKGFLGGVFFIILLAFILSVFIDGMSPFETVVLLADNPIRMTGFVQLLLKFGIAAGLIVQFFSYLAKRNTERLEKDSEQRETNRLMREYLERKLKDENDE